MSQSLDIIRKFLEVKSYIANNLVNEGLMILRDLKNKGILNEKVGVENNWFICNIIDIIDCKYMLDFLDEFAEFFDITRCKSLAKVLNCAISENKDSKYLDMVLQEYKRRSDISIISEIIQTNREKLINLDIIIKIVTFYKELNDVRSLRMVAGIVLNNLDKFQEGEKLRIIGEELKEYLTNIDYNKLLDRANSLISKGVTNV